MNEKIKDIIAWVVLFWFGAGFIGLMFWVAPLFFLICVGILVIGFVVLWALDRVVGGPR